MTDSVLVVSNVGKAYRQYSSEIARVLSWFNISTKPANETWVLQDISFSLAPGEAVGIVGQNGAGKSTLLKMVTGTQHPTTGEINVSGRIGAILELGMGFNPDFTGRQNAYHSAGLMGFSQAEIESVMPEIEVFAEVGEYFDRPVNTYSSGMQMRVAFSVITAFRPEILIIDEALSVGDAYFQHKSFSRIRDFQKQGTALLIVSHDSNAIKSLCNRVILIEKGHLIKDGTPDETIDYYNAILTDKDSGNIRLNSLQNGKLQTISGTGEASIIDVTLFNRNNDPVELVNVGENVVLRIHVQIESPLNSLVLGYMIKDRLGQEVYGTNTQYTKQILYNLEKQETLTYEISFSTNLGPGSYSVAVALVSEELQLSDNFEWQELALIFNVANLDKTPFGGSAWIEPAIAIQKHKQNHYSPYA
ncbi:ABC transporter ATP-binding protein [Leptothoe sp. PORK10 BA2]|uniref:ABC transporter ATP-binding protein n=1 Tax=Leptothoe sp. PORK10 BA2 TaxID=3110254 RepID=UPI002B1FAE86|nr:ABC transporter ATP-binding protein [Leptothoe sp. PORK10 BA2]MEA5462707.1 ABC transporter ATP-binding protein [Leptothoe sp. PORK10 BA2]